MASTKISIIANFGGNIWGALIGIAFVPLYLQYLTIETYGVIGIFASLQAVMSLLDVGLGPALGREISRIAGMPGKEQEMRNLVRTIELPYWAMSVFIALLCAALAPVIAHYWVNPEGLSETTVSQSLMIMSLGFGFQWAGKLAGSGLVALQQQVLLNSTNALFQTIRSVGALAVLVFIAPTIQAFLIWQAFSAMTTTVISILMFWRCLPPGENPRFDFVLLKGIWRYAAGMLGISVVSLVLSQLDKIILSKMLSLEMFGYYSLATTVATLGLGMIVTSIGHVYATHFARLVALDDEKGLRELYHKSSQIMSVFLIPAMSVMIVFSYQIMLVWTRKEEVAANTYLLLSLAALGTGCNGLMHIPYYVQLAYGYTKFAFWQNVIMIILLVPVMPYLCHYYGAIGGAATWALLNFLYVVVGMQIINLILMKGELKRWYLQDVGLPLLVTGLIVVIGKIILPPDLPTLMMIASLMLISSIAFVLVCFATPYARQSIFYQLKRFQSQ